MIVFTRYLIFLISFFVAFLLIKLWDMIENDWYFWVIFFQFLSRCVLVENWKHQKQVNHCHDCSVSNAKRSVGHDALNNRANARFIWFQKSPDCIDQIHEDSFIRSCWTRIVQAWWINQSHVFTFFNPYQMSHCRNWLGRFKMDWNEALPLSIFGCKHLW